MHRLSLPRVTTILLLALCGCSRLASVSLPTTDGTELVFYDWFDGVPDSIIDQFSSEYGVRVTRHTFTSAEQAIQEIRRGMLFDVAVVDGDDVLSLRENGLIADLNLKNIPNQKYLSNDFRGLYYDPDTRYSIPFNWGTTGLLVRSDLAKRSTWYWNDLWDPRLAGQILIRNQPLEMIAVAMKASGFRVNSEDPQALSAVQERLLALRSNVVLAANDETAVEEFLQSNAILMVGWTLDAAQAKNVNPAIQYVLPDEGAILWNDNLVVSAHSAHREEAELLINFLLRPEVSAQITNATHYPTANEAARTLLSPSILSDPLIFPGRQQLKNGEWYMQLTPAGEKAYADLWQRFLTSANGENQ